MKQALDITFLLKCSRKRQK